ncbi:restriction endonuclease subunit S [Thioalkalivibrio sp. ALE9]|uniref:restriction endonuclease subunit S n=1 Tax=Thioalkalivibrio sp. ALE9 TaxID=1158169 RepID=UPI00036C21EC|nr:restriction endonuclease subunit S [Thioalkalivibrio sp. ALE9]
MSARDLITEHLDLWTGAVTTKSTAGRGRNGKIELTGIQKLRELILELAVRGKLVEQDPNDAPADTLLERIAAEKASLVKDGKFKSTKTPPTVSVQEEPFDLPPGWSWTRLGIIAQINPRNDADDTTPASFVSMPMISTSYDGCHEQEQRPWGEIKKGYTHIAEGDIAIAKITPCFENSKAAVFTNLSNGIGAGTTELHVARPVGDCLNPKFALYFLKSPRFIGEGTKKMTGSAGQKRVPKDYFSQEPIPLPPLQEQHRIVEKVGELMALCDRLEQRVGDQLEAHEVLVDTLLDALTRATDAGEVAAHWARIAEHFDTLFTTESSIDKLKQVILQLAVMGRLVGQDPNDEPASVLLERIAKEKTRLVKDGKIKKPKRLPDIEVEERSYQTNKNWAWARFQDIANEISTGPFGSMIHKHDYVDNGVPLINPSHMINGEIQEDRSVSVPGPKAEELASYKLSPGDIVMARRGEVGRCSIVTDREAGWLCGTGSFVLRFHDALSRRFILMIFTTDSVRSYLTGNSVGTTMTNLNHGILNKMPVALPPANEQHRIVEKVDELTAFCDQLKARLGEASETRSRLAETAVEQAVN